LNKLNDRNNQFISAYNAHALNNREKEGKKEEQRGEVQSPVRREPKPSQEMAMPQIKDTTAVEEQFKASIKCRSFSNQPKLDGEYEVTVTGHEVVNPNPFVPNYVLYSISTNPIGVEVKRRLKDF
jgi:hypothetical protein